MKPPVEALKLLSSHQDQVTRLPECARLIASSAFCPIAGFVFDDVVMTLQGHPEFVKDYSRALMTMRRELIGEEAFQSGMASLAEHTDEELVGQWMINFVSA